MSNAEVKKHIESLNNKDFEVRKNAIWVLGEMGKEAKEAVPALLMTLNDKEDELHYLATYALVKIGKETMEVVPELIGALKSEHIRITSGVDRILRKIGRDEKRTKDLAIIILQMLNGQDTDKKRVDVRMIGSCLNILGRLRVNDQYLRKTINNLLIEYD